MSATPPPLTAQQHAAIRARIAEALMRWADGNSNPAYASIRRPETVTVNARSRADAVLAVVQPELDRLRASLAAALQVLDDGPQWVNDRVQQHWSVPAMQAAEILRASLTHTEES